MLDLSHNSIFQDHQNTLKKGPQKTLTFSILNAELSCILDYAFFKIYGETKRELKLKLSIFRDFCEERKRKWREEARKREGEGDMEKEEEREGISTKSESV